MIYGEDRPIIIWAYGDYYTILQEAVNIYRTQINSNVQINVVEIFENEIYELLETVSENDYPNIIVVNDIFIPKFTEGYRNKFVHLENELDITLFKDYKLPYITNLEGHIIACPLSSGTVALYYRKDIFDYYGITLTDNLSVGTFIDYGREIKQFDENKYLLPPAETFSSYLMQATGELFYDSAWNLSCGQSEEVFNLIEELIDDSLIPTNSMDIDQLYNDLIEGNILSIIAEPYAFSKIKREVLDNDDTQVWDVVNIPKSNIFSNNVNAGNYSMMVLKQEYDSNPDYTNIFDFLTTIFYTNDSMSQDFYFNISNNYDKIPAVNYMSNILSDLSNEGCFNRNVISYLDSLDFNAPDIYYGIYIEEIKSYFNQLASNVANETTTIVIALQDLSNSFIDDFYYNTASLDYIEMISGPIKTTYYNNEYFDPSGMIIEVFLTDGTSFETTVDPIILLKTGDTSVTIVYEYNGTSDSVIVNVSVDPRTLQGLLIETNEYYLHQTTLTNSAFKVYATYNIGQNYLTNNFEILNPYLSSCGQTNIMIRYTEGNQIVSSSKEINVRRKLEGISLIENPKKMIYSQGERINLNGAKILANYSNGQSQTYTSGVLDVSNEYIHFNPGQNSKNVEIKYIECGIKKTTSLKINKQVGIDIENAIIDQDFDECGRGNINLNTGLFKYYYEDLFNENPTQSINISRCYNPDSNYQAGMGEGNRLNIDEELKYEQNIWKYITFDGKEYKFDDGYSTDNNRSDIRNEELGLDLFIDDIENEIMLVDRNNNTMIFKLIIDKYKLIKICNYPSTKESIRTSYTIEINYDNLGKIINVTGGCSIENIRPSYTFIYENNLLKYINYLGTNILEYGYLNNKLISIKRINSNVLNNYCEETIFSYNTGQFSIFNKSKKDSLNNYYELRYEIDTNTDKVLSYSYGYGNNSRDITEITYYDSTSSPLSDEDAQKSIIIRYKNIINVLTLNMYQVISKYSYKIDEEITYPNYKPLMIISAESNGLDIIGLYEKYSDDLEIIKNDFENGIEGFNHATIDTTRFISGTKCIKRLNGNITKTFNNIIDNKTCFISFWIMNSTKIEILIDNEEIYSFKPNTSLVDIWQFYFFPIGKISLENQIEIIIHGTNAYLDDFVIIKAPYEKKNNIPEIKYNKNGNIDYKREYDQIENEYILTRYYYDNNNQCRLVKQNKENREKRTEYEYQNGLITSIKNYVSETKYIEQDFSYVNDVCINEITENNKETQFLYSSDEKEETIIGELKSPNYSFSLKNYMNSNFLKIVEETNYKNNYTYNQFGQLSRAESGYYNNDYKTKIDFLYDSFNNLSEVKIGNITLFSQIYDNKKRNSINYGNGLLVEFIYDDEERIIAVEENNVESFNISYLDTTKSGVVISHNNGMTYNMNKILSDSKISQFLSSKEGYNTILKIIDYSTNSFGNISTLEFYNTSSNLIFEKVKMTKNKDGIIKKIERLFHGAELTNYEYDLGNRLLSKKVKYRDGYTYNTFDKKYTYKDLLGNRTTVLVETEKLSINNSIITYRYEYYVNGNISKIYKNNILEKEYEYDSHNRLIAEDNYTLNKRYEYEYDSNGNILTKKLYTIINGIILSGTYETDSYDYQTITPSCGQNQAWGDQLKSYNQNPISYDNLGNITNYLNKSLVWQGRKLIQINSVNMEYDYNNLRIRKGNRIYYWNNKNIVIECFKENNIEKFIYYYYDEKGVCGMFYNNQEYFFDRNILGDVIAIYNKFGNLECRYEYDSFGNHKIYDNQGMEVSNVSLNIGNINPFRYRGYYYDKEFNLYYLKTRYYDPNLGRFISSDMISYANPESVMGYNLYAYCNNNPVMYSDGEGNLPQWANWLIAGAGVLLIAGLAIATVVTGGAAAGLAGAICAGALKGAVIGGAIGTAVGAGVGYAIDGVDGMLSGMAIGFSGGALVGAIIGGVGAYLNYGNFATPDKLNIHFKKHGNEFSGLYSNSTKYAKGAKYTIRHGTKITYTYKGKEAIGYVRFIGNAGKANYAFVGMNGSKAATFGVRSVASLVKELGVTAFLI